MVSRPAVWMTLATFVLATLFLTTATLRSGAGAPEPPLPPGPPSSDGGFRGQTAPVGAPSAGEPSGALFDVTTERLDDDDAHHVTWNFGDGGSPSYTVAYTNSQPLEPGSGAPVAVAGDVYLHVQFSPARRALLSGEVPVPTYEGPLRFDVPDNPNIEEIVFIGDFEAEMTWYIGMDQMAGFDVETTVEPGTISLTLYDPLEGIATLPVLGVGSSGPEVLALEQTLRGLGYLGRDSDTARFDEDVRDAVVALQQDEGIVPTGVVGPETWFEIAGAGIMGFGPRHYAPGLHMDGRLPTPTPRPTPTPVPTPQHTIYLTFDDGPNTTWTPGVLERLARYDASATFFVIGEYVQRYPSVLASAVAQGHAVGNHTYHHVDLTGAGLDQFFNEVSATQATIASATGVTSLCLRPPYGATSQVVRDRAADLGLTTVLWDIDPQDWRRPGAGAIASHVIEHAYPGAIVLMHDGGGDRSQTLAALDLILQELSQRGYRFAALDC